MGLFIVLCITRDRFCFGGVNFVPRSTGKTVLCLLAISGFGQLKVHFPNVMDFASRFAFVGTKSIDSFSKSKLTDKNPLTPKDKLKKKTALSSFSSDLDEGEEARTIRKADTNIISLNMGFLTADTDVSTGDPIFCSQCSAVLNQNSVLAQSNGYSKDWVCEFCDTTNKVVVDEHEIPKSDAIDYLLVPPSNNSEISTDDTIIVYCIGL